MTTWGRPYRMRRQATLEQDDDDDGVAGYSAQHRHA